MASPSLTDEEIARLDSAPAALSDEDIAQAEQSALSDEDIAASEAKTTSAPPSPAQAASPEDEISIEDLQAIASKHGVSIQDLAGKVPYYNLSIKGIEGQGPERLAGKFSEAAGGLPTKAYRMAQSPNMEAALDDIATYAQEHKSLGQMATETAIGVAMPVGLVGKAAKALSEGKSLLKGAAVTGAVHGAAEGFGRSESGEELESAGKFAAGGAILGPLVAGGAQKAAEGLGILRGKAVESLTDIQAKGGTSKVLRDEQQALATARASKIREEAPGLAESVIDNGSLGTRMDIQAPAVRPEYVAKVQQRIDSNEVSPQILSILEKEGIKGEAAALKVAQLETLSEAREFAKYLANKSNIRRMEQVKQTFAKQVQNGPEFLTKEYSNYLQTKAVQQLVKEGVIAKVPRSADWLRKATLFIIDGKSAHRLIDDRIGTSLEVTLDDFTSKQNNYMDYLHKVLSDERFKNATDALRKSGADANVAVYDALDKGARESLAEPLRPVYDTFKKLFEEGANEARKGGLKLESRANYIPYKIQDTVDLVKSFDAQIAKLPTPLRTALETREITQETLDALKKNPIGKEIVQAVSVLSGSKPSQTASHFSKRLAMIQDPRMLGEKVETAARSAYMREGDIPSFIREKNIARLYSNWNQDTFRHLSMRDAISDMKLAARKALAMGAKDDANYIVDHMKDLLGVRRGTAASWFKDQKLEWKVKFTKLAQEAEASDSPLKGLYKGLAAAPEFMPVLFNQIYPNFLGLSPRAALMNAAQPFLMTVPEMGYAYGTPRVLSAYMDMAKLLQGKARGKVALNAAMAARLDKNVGDLVETSDLVRLLKGTGRTPTQFQGELMDTLSRGISENSLYKGIQKPLEWWNDVAMSAFTGAETLNRMAASLTGLGIAQDIFGHNGARMQAAGKSFVERMGSGYRRTISEALQRGDKARVAELLQNYMISKTIFNYNRATMSAYGRSMGPLLSTFTKWPLSIAGDIVQNFSRGETVGQKIRGGVTKTGMHYMAPLALLYAANAALRPGEDNEMANRLLGSKGLAGVAPVSAVGDIVSGELQAPPVVSVVRNLGAGLVTADANKLWKAMNDGFAAFFPIVPALADSLIGLQAAMTNEPKPKGTLMGKVAQAMGADTNPDEVVRDFTQEIKESLFGN